jgi:hypothetical protein
MNNIYDNLKILKRMRSKTIVFIYLFYICFAEYVFVNKVGFDIILISCVLTFLLTFALGAMLKDEYKHKRFFNELKNEYNLCAKNTEYTKEDLKNIDNKIVNEESLTSRAFLLFSILIGSTIGVVLAFKYGSNISYFYFTPILIILSVLGLIAFSVYLFEETIEEFERIKHHYSGINKILYTVLFKGIIIPIKTFVYLIAELFISMLGLIIGVLIIVAIATILFGGFMKVLAAIWIVFIDTLVIILSASIGAAVVFGLFYIFGFGYESFSKKDILLMKRGLSNKIDTLKYKHNIDNDSFKIFDSIKYILLFSIPFILAYIWSSLTSDVGFNILTFLKPSDIIHVDIFRFVPGWNLVTEAKGFFNTILSFISTAFLFVVSLITIPFMLIIWVLQYLYIFIVAIFNSIIGFLLVSAFLFPVLYASYLKFKNDKSLTNFTMIYIYLSFIMIIFFLSLL